MQIDGNGGYKNKVGWDDKKAANNKIIIYCSAVDSTKRVKMTRSARIASRQAIRRFVHPRKSHTNSSWNPGCFKQNLSKNSLRSSDGKLVLQDSWIELKESLGDKQPKNH